MDLVESVRLMAANELAVIDHWRSFVQAACVVLACHGGRLVKSLGDGIMAEFDSARLTFRTLRESNRTTTKSFKQSPTKLPFGCAIRSRTFLAVVLSRCC